jgi:hypothetical protein
MTAASTSLMKQVGSFFLFCNPSYSPKNETLVLKISFSAGLQAVKMFQDKSLCSSLDPQSITYSLLFY